MKTLLSPQDIKFLDSLAHRISRALYYDKIDAIGTNGSISPGLLHDDYDRLRKITQAAKLTDWEETHSHA